MQFNNIELENTEDIAAYIASLEAKTYLFIGNLGAGKTSLIKQLLRIWGSQDEVTSHTFSLLNEYNAANNTIIYHSDWYRINSPEELYDAGIMEYFEQANSKYLIEWPQVGLDYVPKPYVQIEIEHQEKSRNYKIEAVQ